MTNYAVARNSDPDTSWEAAHSLKNLTQIQNQVLGVLKQIGPATDEAIHEFYEWCYDIRVSPSTTRTRRKELQDMKLVVLVDRNGKTKGGRRCQRFSINHVTTHLQLELV
jgi:hypothetical protein